jgi:arsenate reductase
MLPAVVQMAQVAAKGEIIISEKINILFLCTGNSCRSQMAEGFARHLKNDLVNPFSAGIETHGLNPYAVKVMAEVGVDISNHNSKHLDDLKDIKFDYVVTVCSHANETCPIFQNADKKIHVSFDDPPKLAKVFNTDKEKLDCYRKVRDQIKEFIMEMPGNLS